MAKCLFWYLFNSCPKISLFQCFPNVNVKLFWVLILGCIRHVLIEFWIYCIYREAQEEQAKERKRDLMRRAKAAAIQEVERIQGRCLEVYLLLHKVFCSFCSFCSFLMLSNISSILVDKKRIILIFETKFSICVDVMDGMFASWNFYINILYLFLFFAQHKHKQFRELLEHYRFNLRYCTCLICHISQKQYWKTEH